MGFGGQHFADVNKMQEVLLKTKFKDDANTIVEELIEAVNEYNKSLDEKHEAGVMLASFGQSVTVNITGIGYKGAKLIRFTGYSESGAPVELLQHVNQLNFLMVSLPRESTEEPKKQIGFIE
jgi:ABC-type hemin transport system substrate-binding protein